MTAATLAGCASTGPTIPSARLLQDRDLGITSPPGGSVGAWPEADWYSDFHDPRLDALIARAIEGAPSLRGALARADRALAVTGASRAGLWPQVGLQGDSTRQRFSEHGLIPPPYAGTIWTVNALQLSGSWELDLFGQHRAELEAAIGHARAADADAQAARVLLSTQVARGWFALARLLEQQRTLTEILEQRRQTVGLVKNRVASGLDTNVELRQAETHAFEIDRDLALLAEQVATTRHALAALTGQGPEALADAAPQWRAAGTLAWPTEVPADLLGRRADLTAARLRVEASTREVAAARAQFYPNVNLQAFVGLSALGFSHWIEAGSRTWGVGPALRLPVFEAGKLRANLRARSAEVDSAIASYNGALLDAARDVADQLGTLRALKVQQERQAAVQQAADQAQQLATARYQAGLGTFLTVLQAQSSALTQRRVSVDLRFRMIDSQIALVHALGGGYRSPVSGAHRDPMPGVGLPDATSRSAAGAQEPREPTTRIDRDPGTS